MKPAEIGYIGVGSHPSLGLGRRGVAGVSTGKGALRVPGLPLPRADNGALPAQPTNCSPKVEPGGNTLSAGGSGVHSCLRAWRRFPPFPALWAPLEAYYSPSLPLDFNDVFGV